MRALLGRGVEVAGIIPQRSWLLALDYHDSCTTQLSPAPARDGTTRHDKNKKST